MSSVQLSFSLRTSPNCKTVHLIGSWDSYKGQLPLSKSTSKKGAWKGQFRFQNTTLKPGQRYWYYYIIDGYHVSHDPSQSSVTEPTTGRKLNILDIPKGSSGAKPEASSHHVKRSSLDITRGRALSPSRIQSPKPVKPGNQRPLTSKDFGGHATVQALSRQFASVHIDDDSADDDSDNDSETSSDLSAPPSLTSSGSSRCSSAASSNPSSVSSACTCERYGITRKGDRVRLDCGGSRCGSDLDSGCSSDEEIDTHKRPYATRRQGIVVSPC